MYIAVIEVSLRLKYITKRYHTLAKVSALITKVHWNSLQILQMWVVEKIVE